MTQKPIGSAQYAAFVKEMKSRIFSARVSAARAVNRDLIFLYWDIGRPLLKSNNNTGGVSRLLIDCLETYAWLSPALGGSHPAIFVT